MHGDSRREVLDWRVADKFSDVGGPWSSPASSMPLRPARGELSAVFASLCAPEVSYVIHGSRRLVLRAHAPHPSRPPRMRGHGVRGPEPPPKC